MAMPIYCATGSRWKVRRGAAAAHERSAGRRRWYHCRRQLPLQLTNCTDWHREAGRRTRHGGPSCLAPRNCAARLCPQAFMWGSLTGLAEPLGGVLGYLLVHGEASGPRAMGAVAAKEEGSRRRCCGAAAGPHTARPSGAAIAAADCRVPLPAAPWAPAEPRGLWRRVRPGQRHDAVRQRAGAAALRLPPRAARPRGAHQ